MSTMGERIRISRENKGLLQAQLAKLISVKSSGVISNWEKDINKPDADKIVKLCEALDVSASYLLDYSGVSDFNFSLNEKEHIEKYRTLDDFGRETVDWNLEHEYNRCISANAIEEDVNKFNVITLLCSEQAASAGRGTYLGVETFNKIKVVENELTRRAHFAVPVSGSSMEPKYHDGDILLIEKVSELQKGEIGIFTLEGEGYVKELGNNNLISLNPSYEPITINDNGVTLNGKVIGVLEFEWIIE